MTFNVSAFRISYPEFKDTEKYTVTMINTWAAVAMCQVRARVWKSQYLLGVSLYTAHQITLAAQNVNTANFGGTPGTFGGIANTKTVGSATVGYDSNTTTEKDAGFWNLTNYGKQYIHLAKIFGAGCVQL